MRIKPLLDYVDILGPIVALRAGTKRPYAAQWNLPDAVLSTPDAVRKHWRYHPHDNVGLALSYAHCAAIDIDDFAAAAVACDARGFELEDLLTADDAVLIDSGRTNRAKLLYRIPGDRDPFRTVSAVKGLQFRCANHEGYTLQDVLPPSIHPDTGSAYRWIGNWRAVPLLPEELRTWWCELVGETTRGETTEDGDTVTLAILRDALHTMPCDEQTYERWLEFGMALHDFAPTDEAFAVWDEWSAADAGRYVEGECLTKWRGFKRRTRSVTWRSIWTAAAELGWAPPGEMLFDEIEEYAGWTSDELDEDLESPNRTRWIHQRDIAEARPVEWLIEGILEADSLAAFVGRPGTMKSFLAIDMALHVANGLPWGGGFGVSSGVVVYIAGEGQGGLGRRIRAWNIAHEVVGDAPFYLMSRRAYFLEKREPQRIVRSLQSAGLEPRLIVIDTLSRNFGPGDENRDMAAFIGACDQVREGFPGSSVLILHHTSKANTEGPRGHSAFEGAVDAWGLVDTAGIANGVGLTMQKMRESELPPTQLLRSERVVVHTDAETGEATQSLVLKYAGVAADSKPEDKEDRKIFWRVRFLRSVQNDPNISQEARAAAMDTSRGVVRIAAAWCEGNKLVRRRGSNYQVTQAGDAYLEEHDVSGVFEDLEE